MTAETYHPVPQNSSLRPQRPSGPQQAPHVGVHTQLFGVLGPQVPSSVIAPVCHAGGVAVVWATTTTAPESRSPRKAARGASMMKASWAGLVEIWPGWIDGPGVPLAARLEVRATAGSHVIPFPVPTGRPSYPEFPIPSLSPWRIAEMKSASADTLPGNMD